MRCSICDQIPPSSVSGANTELPAAVSALKSGLDPTEPPPYGPCALVDLRECLECGLWYLYTAVLDFDDYWYGMKGNETLDRMTREQSDVVHAMLGCRADPAAIEDAFFALPPTAFRQTLQATCRRDRDFIARFIPRLVHAFATRSQSTGDTLNTLVDHEPSYAREVLAAATSLPPELRDGLEQLEQRCRDAATK
jgi:hypothetical protein